MFTVQLFLYTMRTTLMIIKFTGTSRHDYSLLVDTTPELGHELGYELGHRVTLDRTTKHDQRNTAVVMSSLTL